MIARAGLRIFIWLAWVLSLGCVAGCGFGQIVPRGNGGSGHGKTSASTLRIGMWTLWHDHQLTLTPGGGATFRTCDPCSSLPLKHGLTLRAIGNTIAGASSSPEADFLFSGPVTLTAHGETETLHYPLSITAHNGELVVVVTLPVEAYVERVVSSESGPADTQESLKALAIVVRTYALHVPHGHTGYDLCDSTHCQLLHWAGIRDRATAAHAATLATAGETLWYHHQPALAYFNKYCGGFTASPDQVWPGGHSAAYLPSRPDPYCVRSGGNDWAGELTRQEIASALAGRGLARSGWQHLSVARRAESGRVLAVSLDATEISAEEFRLAIGAALGWNRIPSDWFEVAQQGDRFFFHGRGWGHGVGLCQKGAAVMAAQNHSTSEILSQYFPGAEAVDDVTGRAWNALSRPGFVLESLDRRAAQYMPAMERARAEASQRSGLGPTQILTVRAFPSTSAYRDATLAPGWVAAFTEGDFIATQPLAVLASRGLLNSILVHEFLHALIERQSSSAAPLWLREGLAEVWSGPAENVVPVSQRTPSQPLSAVDGALIHAATEAESTTAHRDAGIYTARLLQRYGRNQVIDWLGSGVPASVLVAAR